MNLFSLNIDNLRLWLTWELSASVLFALSFFRIVALFILGPVILLFIPILIGTLFLEKRFGWLLFFGLFVLTPSVLIYLIIDFGSWNFALQFVPIGLFFFYCFLLKLTIASWDMPETDVGPELRL